MKKLILVLLLFPALLFSQVNEKPFFKVEVNPSSEDATKLDIDLIENPGANPLVITRYAELDTVEAINLIYRWVDNSTEQKAKASAKTLKQILVGAKFIQKFTVLTPVNFVNYQYNKYLPRYDSTAWSYSYNDQSWININIIDAELQNKQGTKIADIISIESELDFTVKTAIPVFGLTVGTEITFFAEAWGNFYALDPNGGFHFLQFKRSLTEPPILPE